MSFKVVIPARYASTRLPAKPLALIAGKPMIEHVYRQALKSGADEVVIATDHSAVFDAVQGFGADVCMTSSEHRSGTDRIAEVSAQRGWKKDEIIVNLQGDEPLMPPQLIQQVATNLAQFTHASIATLCERITGAAELFDPNIVKVVFDHQGYALYFSRAPIPWDRDAFAVSKSTLPPTGEHYRHIGMYAYRAAFLREYVTWSAVALETQESLEQLRALWHGHRIHVAEVATATVPGVDTEQDLERVRSKLK
ncbi:MAG: 3-deoxy-manno-octulosonate cytidylyltransferase [Gammaproteobacteria bacterium]|nr:3-deoxy-manno-octulosonate cytidylyltransferase [Gammaproteobacteria bacterium]